MTKAKKKKYGPRGKELPAGLAAGGAAGLATQYAAETAAEHNIKARADKMYYDHVLSGRVYTGHSGVYMGEDKPRAAWTHPSNFKKEKGYAYEDMGFFTKEHHDRELGKINKARSASAKSAKTFGAASRVAYKARLPVAIGAGVGAAYYVRHRNGKEEKVKNPNWQHARRITH